MRAAMGAMVSITEPMTEAVIEAHLSEASKPETAERTAVFKKNRYDALAQKGFKPQDALQLVMGRPLPTVFPTSK